MRYLRSCLTALLCSLMAGAAMAGTLDLSVLDDSGKPLPDAVVFLDSPQAKRAVKPLSGMQMSQKDLSFHPSLLVVTTGTSVAFPNMDTVRHHVYSFSPTKRFELKLYVGTPLAPVTFDHAGVVVLGCNIHDQMIGYILVVDTPYHGITGQDGHIVLRDVPAGTYSLRIWHGRLINGAQPQTQTIQIGSSDQAQKITLKGLSKK